MVSDHRAVVVLHCRNEPGSDCAHKVDTLAHTHLSTCDSPVRPRLVQAPAHCDQRVASWLMPSVHCQNVGGSLHAELTQRSAAQQHHSLHDSTNQDKMARKKSRSSAIAERPRDASCQLKSCQLPRNSAETTYTTSPDQIDGIKLEI